MRTEIIQITPQHGRRDVIEQTVDESAESVFYRFRILASSLKTLVECGFHFAGGIPELQLLGEHGEILARTRANDVGGMRFLWLDLNYKSPFFNGVDWKRKLTRTSI